MVMFGSTSNAFRPGATGGGLFGATTTTSNTNPMKDFEVSQPPDDSIQTLKFSPPAVQQNFLVSGSWDNVVRVWEVKQDGSTEPKAQQSLQGPIMEVDWSDDGSKIFVVSADKTVRMWDIASNQLQPLGTVRLCFLSTSTSTVHLVFQHDQPVKTCNWIKSPTYSCLMTGSWDKTLKFWDPRTPGTPMLTIPTQERVYCADVMYPMAVVGTAGRVVKIYKLDSQPQEFRSTESPLKFQHRCVSIFKDKNSGAPTGYALGSIEGRVAIQYVETQNPKDNFTFKCHRSPELNNGFQDIYAVNDIAFHPVHGTLATVGSDGRFSFWDKDARTKLKTSEALPLPISRCAFNKGGEIFAYSASYDWSKGHEYYKPEDKNYIFLHSCFDELKPRPKNK